MEIEEWRVIPAYSKYEVSSLGRVRNGESGKLQNVHFNCRTGYSFVQLFPDVPIRRMRFRKDRKKGYLGKVARTVRLTSIIARAFLGERPAGMHIDHIDGDKRNESVSNLRYVAPEVNVQLSYDNGQHPVRVHGVPYSISDEVYDEIFRLSRAGFSQVKIGRALGITNGHVCRILAGKVARARRVRLG